MKKTAVALGLTLAFSAMAVTAQTEQKMIPGALKAAPVVSSEFCKVNLTSVKPKAGAKLKRVKAKHPGKPGLHRISRRPQMDVCDNPDLAQPSGQPVAQGGTDAGSTPSGTGGAIQMASGDKDKLPEGDLTKILEPTAAGPAAAAPGGFSAPSFAPASLTSAPSFGGGGGGVGVATRN